VPRDLTRRALGGAFATFALAHPALAQGSETERLNAFFERVYQRNLARSPIAQSRRGLKTDNDKWDDISEARELESHELRKRDLAELKAFRFDALEPQAKVSYRLFEQGAQDSIEGYRWRRHDYLVTQMGGLHRRVATVLTSNHAIDTKADAEAYVARLYGVKPLMGQLVEALARQEAAGIKPPKFVFALTIGECENQVKGRPFNAGPADAPVWADFKAKVAKLNLPAVESAALLARGEAGMRDGFGPGYRQLITHLKKAEATADTRDGVWKLPDGEAYYRYQLKQSTTLPVTAEELHALGLREVARIQDEMRGVMAKVGFKGSLQDFFAFVRTDSQFYYPSSAEGRAHYIADAEGLLAKAVAKQGEVFNIKPKAKVEVRAVEGWREKSAAKAFYQNPSEDGARPGIFYVNLYDMGAQPRFQLPVVLFHEAVPGHHVETAVAYELKGLPNFRKYSSVGAFSEGWGLYSELLAKEMGLYETPYDEFGRLSLSLMRAARLVVDTGLHAKRWSREQALAYFDENMPASKFDNQREIDRYVVYPGQATSYYVGMVKILELRERARRELGDRFDIRAFHDAVLENGPLPLPLLDEAIQAWIARRKA
jgi:uncharacterized protein (DUF885 family)